MGNFDDAVRAMFPPLSPVVCEVCGRHVPPAGDDEHEIALEPVILGVRRESIVCLVPPETAA